MATRLILIRHGATQWNLKKRYSGFRDICLSSQGRLQAEKLQKRFKKELIDKIYSSDRKRAIETARIVFGRREIERVSGLREIHFGIFEGLTYRQIIQRHPVIYRSWLNDPFSVTIPRGENLFAFKRRVVRSIKKIAALNRGKTIAIVTHGGSISILINNILKSKNFWKHIPKSASLSIVEYSAGKAKIKLFNDTRHL
jgi:broad specificity phosphatase PhoE